MPSISDLELKRLLGEFQEVFEEPHSLALVRRNDHQIPLIQGSSPVKVHPDMYPHYQKNKIEKIVCWVVKHRGDPSQH